MTQNMMKDIEPGATLTCTGIYALSDESTVTVEVTVLFNMKDNEKITKTFDIAK